MPEALNINDEVLAEALVMAFREIGVALRFGKDERWTTEEAMTRAQTIALDPNLYALLCFLEATARTTH